MARSRTLCPTGKLADRGSGGPVHGKVRTCIEDVARQWSGCCHTLSASSASSFCRRAVSLHASPAAGYSGGQRVFVRLDACANADVWCGGKRLQITVYEAPHLRPCAQPPSLHAPPRASSHATSSPAVQHMHCEGAARVTHSVSRPHPRIPCRSSRLGTRLRLRRVGVGVGISWFGLRLGRGCGWYARLLLALLAVGRQPGFLRF